MDFELKFLQNYFDIDIDKTRRDVAVERGLDTAALMSIFSQARVNRERGYWGDFLAEFLNDVLGSRLWSFLRGRNSQDTREAIVSAIKDSLNWMVVDSVAQSVDARVESLDTNEVGFVVEVRNFSDETLTAFNFLWDFHRNQITAQGV